MSKAEHTGGCLGEVKQGYPSLSHSKLDCKYHGVFFPKKRRRALFGQVRRHLGKIFLALAQQKEFRILEGHLLPDHVHMCIAIPPKHPVASGIGFLKGKSAIAVAREFGGKDRNFTGEHLWARGYAVTVGFELEQVRQYIRTQEEAGGSIGQSCKLRDQGAL
jgi:putative transposase